MPAQDDGCGSGVPYLPQAGGGIPTAGGQPAAIRAEGQGGDGSFVPAQDDGCGGRVLHLPQTGGVVPTAGSQPAAIRAEGQDGDGPFVPTQEDRCGGRVLCIPQSGGGAGTAGGQPAPIRAEGQGGDGTFVSAQDGGCGRWVLHLPQAGGGILTAGGQPAAIRAEGQGIDPTFVPTQEDGCGGRVLHLPQAGGFIITAGSQPTPIRAEGQGVDGIFVSAQDDGCGGGVLHVPQAGSSILTAGGQPTPIRAEGQCVDGIFVPAQGNSSDPSQGVAQRLLRGRQGWRVGLDRFQRKQHRALGETGQSALGLGCQFTGAGDARPLPRLPGEEDRCQGGGQGQQPDGSDDAVAHPQPPGGLFLLDSPALFGFGLLLRQLQLALALGLALGGLALFQLLRGPQELAFQGIQGLGGRPGPLQRLGQSRPAIQLACILPAPLPFQGAFGQVTLQAQPLPVFVQPLAQGRPFSDQCLMGYLGVSFAGFTLGCGSQPGGGHQAGVGQGLEHGIHGGLLLGQGDQLAQRRPAAGVLRPFAQFSQAQEDMPGDVLLLGRQGLVDSFSGLGNRPAQPARRGVPGQGQAAALAALPGFQQGVREQRQRPRLIADIPQHQVNQAVFQFPAAILGGQLDGLAQFSSAHRPDVLLIFFQCLEQGGVPGAVMVEVGPQGDHQQRGPGGLVGGGGEQVVDKGFALGGVFAGGEGFLELVDHQQQFFAAQALEQARGGQIQAARLAGKVIHQGGSGGQCFDILGQAGRQLAQRVGGGGQEAHLPVAAALGRRRSIRQGCAALQGGY